MTLFTRTSLRIVAATTLACVLAACGGGGNNDTIRIGSGQTANSGTTGSTDFPIFYVKRVTPDMTKANAGDVRRQRVFYTNADLYRRDAASPSAAEHNITARVHPANELWDVKDVDISADGTKVIFAMRGPLQDTQKDKDPPNWGIWEYVIASDDLHRVVVQDDLDGNSGQYVSPHYLPDGHILFSSTRQKQSKAILTDENKTPFEAQVDNRGIRESGFVLHVMDGTGGNLQQISFNQSHDMDPTVLTDGRVLFSRWDAAPGRNGVHLYSANPDGTNTQLEFGSASHSVFADVDPNNTTTYPAVQLTKPREMPDGRILTIVRPFTGTEFGGDMYIIDTKDYVEANQLAVAGGAASTAALSKATPGNVRLVNAPSPGGRYVSAAPLWDGSNRILAAWTQCRLIDPATSAFVNCTSSRLADPTFVAAPPTYSLWMFNPNDGTQQPIIIATDGVMVTDVVVAQARTVPAFKPILIEDNNNPNINQALRGEGVGILDIRSVYDFDGAASNTGTGCSIATDSDPSNPTCYPNRPARFLRIEKAVSLPDRDVRDIDNNAFGATNFMREILGYIPIEPDGSVRTKVPGNVAFQISIVDTDGRRVPTFPLHNAWLTIRPGETVQCNGCHRNSTNVPAGQSGRSHGRSGSFASAYAGAVSGGIAFSNANLAFLSTNTGDTMARARAAWSCANEQCASIAPSVNVAFANVWPSGTTDSKVIPAMPPRTGDFVLPYAGAGGLTTKIPTSSTCLTVWSNICRITINYLENIQPIWERPLGVDVNGDTVADEKDNCLACHGKTNAAGMVQVPAGQLDLTQDASDDNNLRITSYQELLFQDNEQELNAGGTAVQDHCIQTVTDPVTMVVTCAQFGTVSPVLSARNARGSRFFNTFTNNTCLRSGATVSCSVDHRTFLTVGELRLISEWVDIGAQYYNDPFKAPVN